MGVGMALGQALLAILAIFLVVELALLIAGGVALAKASPRLAAFFFVLAALPFVAVSAWVTITWATRPDKRSYSERTESSGDWCERQRPLVVMRAPGGTEGSVRIVYEDESLLKHRPQPAAGGAAIESGSPFRKAFELRPLPEAPPCEGGSADVSRYWYTTIRGAPSAYSCVAPEVTRFEIRIAAGTPVAQHPELVSIPLTLLEDGEPIARTLAFGRSSWFCRSIDTAVRELVQPATDG